MITTKATTEGGGSWQEDQVMLHLVVRNRIISEILEHLLTRD